MIARSFLFIVIVPALSATQTFAEEPKKDLYGDPLPEGAISRIGTIRLRNVGDIEHVLLSPDGKILVTSDNRRPLQVWNAVTGALLREIPLPDDDRVDTPFGRKRMEEIAAMSFITDANRLHVLTKSGNLRDCNLSDGNWTQSLARSEQGLIKFVPISGGSVSPDGNYFFFSPRNEKGKGIELLQVGKDKRILQIEDPKFRHYGHRLAVSVSADNRLMTAVLEDGTAKLWDLRTGKEVSKFSPPDHLFLSVAISPDGKSMVAVCGPEGSYWYPAPTPEGTFLYGWDIATGKELFRVPNWEGYTSTYSPDGQRIISFSKDEVLVLDAATGKLEHRLRGHESRWITAHGFSKDGKRLVTGGRDHTAIIWDLTTGKPILDFESPRGSVDVLAFSPDGKKLFAGCADGHPGGLWEADSGKRLHWLIADGKGNPLSAAFTPDGKNVVVGYGVSRAASTGNAWTARVWSVGEGKIVREFSGHTDGVHNLAISPDGKQLATSDWGKKVRIWDINSGKITKEIDFATYHSPMSLVFQKSNQLLGVTADKDKKAQVFNLTSGKKVETGNVSDPLFTALGYLQDLVAFSPGRELLVAFSPDRKLIAKSERESVQDEGSVDLYEISTGKLLRTIKGHKGLIESIAFSPDGKRLATGSWDSTVLVWDLTSKP